MNYADIKRVDVANGPGVRVSIFVSGCPHHCEGCFNPETWDYDFGQAFTQAQIDEIISLLRPSYICGLSLLGGEPFAPANQSSLLDLVRQVRRELPDKTIWCYTGYLFENLAQGKVGDHGRELLEQLDVLVDGPFVLARKQLGLRFRGSDNQRLLDVPASLAQNSPVWWEDPEKF